MLEIPPSHLPRNQTSLDLSPIMHLNWISTLCWWIAKFWYAFGSSHISRSLFCASLALYGENHLTSTSGHHYMICPNPHIRPGSVLSQQLIAWTAAMTGPVYFLFALFSPSWIFFRLFFLPLLVAVCIAACIAASGCRLAEPNLYMVYNCQFRQRSVEGFFSGPHFLVHYFLGDLGGMW